MLPTRFYDRPTCPVSCIFTQFFKELSLVRLFEVSGARIR